MGAGAVRAATTSGGAGVTWSRGLLMLLLTRGRSGRTGHPVSDGRNLWAGLRLPGRRGLARPGGPARPRHLRSRACEASNIQQVGVGAELDLPGIRIVIKSPALAGSPLTQTLLTEVIGRIVIPVCRG